MASYVSRHRPRTITIVSGNIQSTQRYDRYYDFTCDLIARGALPIMELAAGTFVFRKSKNIFDLESSRTIPPAEYSAQSLTNRYSGRRLDGMPGEGALYVASLAGMLREHAHYATRPPAPALSGSAKPSTLIHAGAADRTSAFLQQALSRSSPGDDAFHVYQLGRSLRLVDLRVRALFQLFATFLTDAASRARYEIAQSTPTDFLSSALLSTSDYSASRGMADAISDARNKLGVDGLCATSSRGESDLGLVVGLAGEADGAIQVLFGLPGTKIHALTPVRSFASVKDLFAQFAV